MLQAPKPQLELNFIEFVVLPLWRTVAQAFPTFEDRVQTMLSNHERCVCPAKPMASPLSSPVHLYPFISPFTSSSTNS